jgi:regulation of enolase protein 1 (concanavalin A-like superfamily)
MVRTIILIAVAVCSLGLKEAPTESKSRTSFDGWGAVIDPDKDCQVALDGEKLSMTLPAAAHDFAAELERWNAPRVMASAKGDFIAQVKISGTFTPAKPSTISGRTPYNGAGILIEVDKQNYVSLQRAALFRDGKIRHYANFELRQNGQLTSSHFNTNLDDADAYLRLERRGPKIYAMFSRDGVKWQSYEPVEVDFPKAVNVGVEAINSSADAFECSFEGFSIYHKVKKIHASTDQ